jgi:hypothetical protein
VISSASSARPSASASSARLASQKRDPDVLERCALLVQPRCFEPGQQSRLGELRGFLGARQPLFVVADARPREPGPRRLDVDPGRLRQLEDDPLATLDRRRRKRATAAGLAPLGIHRTSNYMTVRLAV